MSRFPGSLAALSGSLLFVLASGVLPPGAAEAQLTPAQWTEVLSLQAGEDADQRTGLDNLTPEELQGHLSGVDYSVDGSVTFGPPGPPKTSCTIITQYNSGDINILNGGASSTISFQLVINALSGAPTVTSVPMNVEASGFVNVVDDPGTFSSAGARFELRYNAGGEALVFEDIIANSGGGGTPTSDAFAVSDQFDVTPGAVLVGTMIGSASSIASFNQGSTIGTASSLVDPTFEIADVMIPGTGDSYRDLFEIEFSEGYWALGDPTPVRKTTWGRIKQLYRD